MKMKSAKYKRTIAVSVALIATMIFVGLPIPFAHADTPTSWNPNTWCTPIVMTLEQFIGNVPNPNQYNPSLGPPGSNGNPTTVGADYSGGALQLDGAYPPGSNPPSSAWPFPYSPPMDSPKRSTNPPCNAGPDGLSTLVEIHGVRVVGVNAMDECTVPNDASACDETFNLCSSAYTYADCQRHEWPFSMHVFHAEIDEYWVHNGIAPPIPTENSIIDVQGFAFWDDAHLGADWHSFSGWELHALTAWESGDFRLGLLTTNHCQIRNVQTFNQVHVYSINGWTGSITLTAPVTGGGVTTSWSSTSQVDSTTITIPPGYTQNVASYYVNSGSTLGTYNVTVNAQGGSGSASWQERVVVVSQHC